MSKRNQYKTLAKRFLKDTLELFPKEEVEVVSDPEDRDEPEEAPVQKKKDSGDPSKPTASKDHSDWKCEGHVWAEPPEPCPGGKNSDQKAGILYNNKRVVVCKGCYLARDRMKNKEKREQKKAGGEEKPKKREREEEKEESSPVKKGKITK
jgi:hypothetical protein